jgi:hypothetical protein
MDELTALVGRRGAVVGGCEKKVIDVGKVAYE